MRLISVFVSCHMSRKIGLVNVLRITTTSINRMIKHQYKQRRMIKLLLRNKHVDLN